MLRGFLDDAFDEGQASKAGLRATLRSYETMARKAISEGSLKHLSMSSRSTAFADHGAGLMTPLQVQEAWRYLVDTFDYRQSIFVHCGTANPGDLQIKTAMLCEDLVAVTEVYPDLTLLNLPTGPCNRPVINGVLTW